MKSIGIIGAGNIGRAFTTALANNNIRATLANSRGPESLKEVVAVNWSKLPAALAGLPDFGGRVVVDANNPIEAPLFKPAELNGRLSSEVFAGMVSGARVVKTFNHLQPHLLSGDPRAEGGRRVLFYSGDDSSPRRRSAR